MPRRARAMSGCLAPRDNIGRSPSVGEYRSTRRCHATKGRRPGPMVIFAFGMHYIQGLLRRTERGDDSRLTGATAMRRMAATGPASRRPAAKLLRWRDLNEATRGHDDRDSIVY